MFIYWEENKTLKPWRRVSQILNSKKEKSLELSRISTTSVVGSVFLLTGLGCREPRTEFPSLILLVGSEVRSLKFKSLITIDMKILVTIIESSLVIEYLLILCHVSCCCVGFETWSFLESLWKLICFIVRFLVEMEEASTAMLRSHNINVKY